MTSSGVGIPDERVLQFFDRLLADRAHEQHEPGRLTYATIREQVAGRLDTRTVVDQVLSQIRARHGVPPRTMKRP